jgi:hypothetical protein
MDERSRESHSLQRIIRNNNVRLYAPFLLPKYCKRTKSSILNGCASVSVIYFLKAPVHPRRHMPRFLRYTKSYPCLVRINKHCLQSPLSDRIVLSLKQSHPKVSNVPCALKEYRMRLIKRRVLKQQYIDKDTYSV